MSTRRCIVIADLDEQSRAALQKCLPEDHFQIIELDAQQGEPLTKHVDLVVFGAKKELEQTEEFCKKLRKCVGQNVPLLGCAGRYVFPLIRPLLGNVFQGLIISPFDADELRRKLDNLDLGF